MDLRKLFLIAVGLILPSAIVAIFFAHPVSAANPQPVIVTNTPTVTVGNTSAAPVLTRDVDATTLTHVGQPPGNLVALFTSSTVVANEGFRRQFPDGSGQSNFTVPTGQALVVTDVNWHCGGAAPGSSVFFDLSVGGQIELQSVDTANSSGNAEAKEHLTTGLLVTGTLSPVGGASVTCGSWNIHLQGYLIPFAGQ